MDYEKHLPLAPRDLLILAVLGEGPLHGYGIIKAVEVRSQAGVLLDPANLYRVLRRMRGAGWIREAFERSVGETPQTGPNTDARRKTYEITRTGRSLLAAELARLERLLERARPALADGSGR
jgi:DNA-binding PadR family transcriptional regulator